MEIDEKIRNVKIVEVIKVELTRGSGLTEKDPVRQVNQYWDFNGNLIYDDDLFDTNDVASSDINS
ncbi:MAG: hypothetical protein NC483_00660 [Ruminococcus sp.]|nr:hypothetical protein [Ruminococcus sp.]